MPVFLFIIFPSRMLHSSERERGEWVRRDGIVLRLVLDLMSSLQTTAGALTRSEVTADDSATSRSTAGTAATFDFTGSTVSHVNLL